MSRLPGLDLLRAVAIVWVLLYHATIMGLGEPVPAVAELGWMGVDLFFVLSGYLIGAQWLSAVRDGRARFGRFYLRRALRILPAYGVVTALYFALPSARERPQIQPLWQFLTFTENLLIDLDAPRAFSHVWSLCVEEHFYLLFPPLAGLLARRPSARRTAAALLGVLLAGVALRAGIWQLGLAPLLEVHEGAGNFYQRYMEWIYYPSWTRLDGLLGGVALAALHVFRPATWAALTRRGDALMLAGALTLACSFQVMAEREALLPTALGYPLLSAGLTLIVAAGASPGSLLGRIRVPGAAALATLAYSVYLSHKLVFHALHSRFREALERGGWAAAALVCAATLLAGAALYGAVERPGLLLRERLLRREAERARAR